MLKRSRTHLWQAYLHTYRSTPSSISFWELKWKKQKHRGRKRLVRLRKRIMSSSTFNNPLFPLISKARSRIPGLSFVRLRSDCQAAYLFLYGLYLFPALLHWLRNHYFTQKLPLVDVIKKALIKCPIALSYCEHIIEFGNQQSARPREINNTFWLGLYC